MKKLICLILSCFILLGLTACGKGIQKPNDTSKDKSKVTYNDLSSSKSEDTATDKSDSSSESVSENTDTSNSSEKIDYDITTLSSTMAYSQVSEMTTNSANYLGKRVKIKGKFLVQETDARNYYACHISDVTACCSIGLEFVLKDTSIKYPDDYPKANDEITVEGIFNTYKEGENTYCELKDAVMIK